MKKLFYLLPGLFFCDTALAQQVRPATSAQIYHEIAQLKNLANVLYVAAHPDDENTRFLAWMVNDQHIRTAYLSLTRGDGGQNILGSEQGAALGLIRTHELLEARKLDGAAQYFTRAIDFGFSKTADETYTHWNEDTLVHDAVWVMRQFRPDVVICRFPPNAMAGHGQHTASAIIAEKAFAASGDKTKYPAQLQHYGAWQPKRILFNSFRFGSRNTTSEDQFKMPVGNYSPLIGMGYGELAGISRSIHRSQGAGTPSTPGIQTEYFKLVNGEPLSASLFDGIDITWGRVDRKDIGRDIETILSNYDFQHPDKSLKALLELRKKIETVKDNYWRQQKLQELDKVILHSSGFMAEAYAKQPQAFAGDTLPFTLRVLARGETPVALKKIAWPGKDITGNFELNNDTLLVMEQRVAIPVSQPVTEPYWLTKPASDAGHFAIPSFDVLGMPTSPNDLQAILTISIGDVQQDVAVPLSFKKLDPTRGDIIEQLRIVPDASVDFTTDLITKETDGGSTPTVHIHAYNNISNATLSVYNDLINEKIAGLNLKKDTDTFITVIIPAERSKGKDILLYASLTAGHQEYKKSMHLIQYEHIPTLQYFTTPSIKVLDNNWKSTAKRIGYVQGAGDHVAEVLQMSGLQVDILKEADITPTRLKKYDAIVTGIRAANTEKRMATWMPVLMQYVNNGGTLVMQYNTLQDMATKDLGPYPFTLSSKRVTEEDATITYIDPAHKLLNQPNKITSEDLQDWVQERGLYFPDKWDSRYQPIFRMNDKGEEPLEGNTLYTTYGKGQYIYTSLAFFRQLPAGNKGAIRLLLNMLSAGGTNTNK